LALKEESQNKDDNNNSDRIIHFWMPDNWVNYTENHARVKVFGEYKNPKKGA
jgi:hypothetical protein